MSSIYPSKHKGRDIDNAITEVELLSNRMIKAEEDIIDLSKHKANIEVVPKSIQDLQKGGEALEWDGGAWFNGEVVGVDYAGNKHVLNYKQPLDFVVNVTTTGYVGGDTFSQEREEKIEIQIESADKTYAEILEAYNAGKRVYLVWNGVDIIPLSSVRNNSVCFEKPVFGSSKAVEFIALQSGWMVETPPDYTYLEIENMVRDFYVMAWTQVVDEKITLAHTMGSYDDIWEAHRAGKRGYLLLQGNTEEVVPLTEIDVNRAVFVRYGYGENKTLRFDVTNNGWAVEEVEEIDSAYQKQEKVFINDNKIQIGSGQDCDGGGANGDITIEQGRIKLGYGNPFDSHTEITQRNIRVGAMSDGDFLPSIDITSESITFRDGDNRTTDEPYINASEVKIINDEKVHKLSEKANAADVAQKLSDVEAALDNKADKEEWKLINEVELTEDAVVEFTTDKDGNAFNLKKFKVTILMPKLETQSQVWLSVFNSAMYYLAVYSDMIPTNANAPALSIVGELTYAWQFETCYSRSGLSNSGTVTSFPKGSRYSGYITGLISKVKVGLSSGLTTPLPAGSKITLWGCEQ